MAAITKEKLDFVIDASPEERAYACAWSFHLFALYYFTKYFTFGKAPFHDDFFQDFEDLVYGRIPTNEAAWIAFRESAKTSIAKMGLAWLIARKQVIDKLRDQGVDVSHWGERLYINVDSYDKANAESLLFDAVTELQTNDQLITDFGHLYNAPRTQEQAQMKRVANFVTNNGIRVEAHTALTPTRGRIFQHHRPDFILRDDLENAITVESPAITEKIIKVLDEAKGGVAPHAAQLTLGNYIIEEGVVGYIKRSLEASGGRVRFIPVMDKQGNLAWPAKYVKTDAEAAEANKDIKDPARRKVSLEGKKRQLNAGGRRVFEVEMMLDPVAAGSPFFDRAIIERLIAQATEHTEDKAGFLMWEPFKPGHRYCIGADTAKGNGNDHNASCAIDFTPIPARQVGSYANNMISPDAFAYELKRESDLLGTCLIAPEKNTESGGICLTTLKMIHPIDWIYRQVPEDKLSNAPIAELGWETNAATKYNILFELKTDVENGWLAISDLRILKELRVFTHSDADDLGRTKQGLATNHFDLLMATAIANYVGKRHAKAFIDPKAQGYVQPGYETPGI